MGHAIIFNTLVVMAFIVQVYNYWKLGNDEVNHYTWLFVLGCFVVTETMVALATDPVYFLYVVLNLFGIWRLFRPASESQRCRSCASSTQPETRCSSDCPRCPR